jgi:ABC-type multidrug transport system fused ATPase/permease subunit
MVLAQEPHLFSGTVRFNLDPFWRYDDHEIWNALEETKLKSFVVESGGLESEVSEGGSNWSTGQRQLLSIARALLHRRRVVLLDEGLSVIRMLTHIFFILLHKYNICIHVDIICISKFYFIDLLISL